jgi:hypothetical protein
MGKLEHLLLPFANVKARLAGLLPLLAHAALLRVTRFINFSSHSSSFYAQHVWLLLVAYKSICMRYVGSEAYSANLCIDIRFRASLLRVFRLCIRLRMWVVSCSFAF